MSVADLKPLTNAADTWDDGGGVLFASPRLAPSSGRCPLCFRAVLLAIGVALGSGCGFEPEGATAFNPPPTYRQWWSSTEACSGLKADLGAVKWATVPGRGFACPSGTCVGRWEPGQRIYLAEAYANHELVVRHEMLHALLGRAGHPDPPFGEGCRLTWETWFATDQPTAPVAID